MDTKDHTYPSIEDTLSADRFGTYLGWAGGDRNRAVDLYTLNAVLSESLYTPLHMLEVALRNRIHQVMGKVHGENWFDLPEHQFNAVQTDMLEKARLDLKEKGKDQTPGRMVASLTFGYWTAMLGKEYENLWQTTLKDIARREDGKGLTRKALSKPLAPIRTLRNRIAHHEPILYWSLPKHHETILQLTTWLSPVAGEWCRDNSRFLSLYPENGIELIKEPVEPVAK
ncbi:hypothetical protein E1A49_22045 [Salmonella enterica subsp. enterica serovar Chester]|nr:hypothetical protein [Salmonella enterica subsp. enterica]EBR0116292.1 hypothetical protein [Salmonella enterica subsp. enterica serovar Newport]EBU7498173.1 hypothetical protein [Salmonella enterica subsp. enterica serovar Typhi]EBU8131888.1 hypothetical protein [Salmonella enterica subsp. enterica serovar Java]EBV3599899.1 hypothetical protein [Salmonella enterica subsp. enterica serovar Virchow]EBW2249990.1 hypothetical protein [Salmonella enterica subsp. enterica serovar Enteritidis]EC